MLDDLFAEIEKNHIFELSGNDLEIRNFEKRYGCQLPDDVKVFYSRYKTVKLFVSKYGWKYRFVPISEMQITGFDIYGTYYENDGPDSWFTICDVMDGNYIAVDLAYQKDGQWNYIDCFHETYGVPGECMVIAKSFTELLERCVHGGDSHYYLEKGFHGYGDALEVTPKTAITRIVPVRSKWGWLGEFIRQRKYPHIQAGWRVKFSQPNNSHLEFFADKDYGGKERSFNAAKRYLDENKR